MKTSLLTAAGVLLASSTLHAAPVVEERTWTESWPVSGAATLQISNIWGSVQVSAGEPGEITVTVSERRTAPDRQRYERSLELYKLDVVSEPSGVSIVVGDRDERWQHRNECRDCRADLQFEVKVPADASVDVATVVDGIVSVTGVGGTISASNVNGPIRIDGAMNCGKVRSVNGAIGMDFSGVPRLDCDINTINGDITLKMPDHTGLNLAMDLFNGKVSSDLPVDAMPLPATVEETIRDGQRRYRIQQMAGLRVGAGGPTYTIASMNGDLRIRKLQ